MEDENLKNRNLNTPTKKEFKVNTLQRKVSKLENCDKKSQGNEYEIKNPISEHINPNPSSTHLTNQNS